MRAMRCDAKGGGGVFGCKEGGAILGFRRQTHYVGKDFTEDVDDAVGEWHGGFLRVRGVVAEEEKAGGATACAGIRERHSVGVDVDDFIFGKEADDRDRVGGSII